MLDEKCDASVERAKVHGTDNNMNGNMSSFERRLEAENRHIMALRQTYIDKLMANGEFYNEFGQSFYAKDIDKDNVPRTELIEGIIKLGYTYRAVEYSVSNKSTSLDSDKKAAIPYQMLFTNETSVINSWINADDKESSIAINFDFVGEENGRIKDIKDLIYSLGYNAYEHSDEDVTTIHVNMINAIGHVVPFKCEFPSLYINDIRDNYTEQNVAKVQSIVDKMNLNDALNGRLIVFHGPPGTGKTYMIRALLSELKAKERYHGHVCTPPLTFIENIDFLLQAVMDSHHNLIVFEDVGELFAKDTKQYFLNHFSNISNLCDGFLSLIKNNVFLFTFNYEIENLDEALTRKGRCLDIVKFDNLPKEHAERLVDGNLTNPSYSLADIYVIKGNNGVEEDITEPQKLGFMK